jgi:hypothetical protein
VKIIGCPLKISRYKYIYFPRLYLERFGIETKDAVAIRENHEDYFVYRPFSDRPLNPNEEIVLIRACSTYIPSSFLHRNGLTPWFDELYLVGIDDGLKVSVNKQVI